MTFTRQFNGDNIVSIRGDGRTVDGRIVPYSEVTTVVDIHPKSNQLERYEEQFLPSSLAHAVQYAERRGNAGFISLNLDHDEVNFSSRIGYAKTLEEREDGAYATFRLYEGRDLEKVQSMLRESHTGLSVKFADTRPPKYIDDVVSHVQVVLEHVGATPLPAYAGAYITALRDGTDEDSIVSQIAAGTPNLDSVRKWLEEMRQS